MYMEKSNVPQYSQKIVTSHQSLYVKVKVKLSLCLTKHHAMKKYWGVEV
jgi:hypothetical protein